MKNNRKHIDDYFREKLGAYSEKPPIDAWQDMDVKLDTLTPHVVPSSPLRWLGHVGMVSLIAVLGVSLVQKFTGKSDNANIVSKEQTINKIDAPNSQFDASVATAGATGVDAPVMNDGDDQNDDNSQSPATAFAANNTGDEDAYVSGNRKANSSYKGSSNHNAGAGSAEQSELTDENEHAATTSGKIAKQENQTESNNYTDNQISNYNSAANPATKAIASGVKENSAKVQQEPKKAVAKQTPKPQFARWEAGIKGGYERGFNNIAATKYVVAPYLQYKLSGKVAIMIQPAVKYANSTVRTIGTPQAFYKVNGDGQVKDNGSDTSSRIGGSTMYDVYNGRYRYTQSHDSIVKTNRTGGTYMEFELPVLVKYELSKKLSAYGGVNIVYSQTKGVTEHTYTKAGIMRSADTLIVSETSMPAAPAIGDVITYNGTPFSDYNGPLYPATQVSRMRLGAMLGISYVYSDRWLLDALIQQNPAPKDMRGGYNINAPLSSTYFRLSVGYKLTK